MLKVILYAYTQRVFSGTKIEADTSYGSEENYIYINDVLQPLDYVWQLPQRKQEKYKNNPFNMENWFYLEE